MYRLGTPITSDIEFDEGLELYRTMVPSEEYDIFRDSLFEYTGEVKHPYIMGSLEKTKSDDIQTLAKYMKRVNPADFNDLIHVSSKIDGCSLRVEYRDGVLINAVTRGDGILGTSILDKARHFIPTTLCDKFTGNIRGEVTLTKTSFITLCENDDKQYKNLRNSTVGLVNSKDYKLENIKLLHFIAYEIMACNQTKAEQYSTLEQMGFEIAKNETILYTDLNEFKNKLDEIYDKFYSECEYDIDGLVITPTTNNVFENEYLPKNIVAYKKNQLVVKTKILDIEWFISKNGYLTPVAILDPVELGGSVIAKASLYNVRNVSMLQPKYGSIVTILKSGDIIPKVLECDNNNSNKTIEIVKKCPFCGTDTVFNSGDVELMCPNKSGCKEQKVTKVTSFIKKIGVENASLKTFKNWNIYTFEDLVNWQPDESYKSQTKVYGEMLSKIFRAPKAKILGCLDFDGIGETQMNKILTIYTVEQILSNQIDCTNLPEGVGAITIDNLYKCMDDNRATFELITGDPRYSEGFVKVERVSGKLDGKSFCFTGSLNTMGRTAAQKLVTQNGGTVLSSVSKTLTYLVTNDTSTGTSKNKKATSLGISIITELQFLDMVNTNSDISNL